MSNTEPLSDAVRNWVHFDNLYAMLSKQAASALNMKKTFEDRVLALIGRTKRIKINSAVLEPATRRNSISMNLTSLEETLHKYYETNNKPDDTVNIIKFVQQTKGGKTISYIMKKADSTAT